MALAAVSDWQTGHKRREPCSRLLREHANWTKKCPRRVVGMPPPRRRSVPPPAVYVSWGICSIIQKKKSVIGCSIPNRFSLEAT